MMGLFRDWPQERQIGEGQVKVGTRLEARRTILEKRLPRAAAEEEGGG